MRSARLSIKHFDPYDRYLLWIALRSGYRYVSVESGRHGYWIAGIPAVGPAGLPNPESGRLIQLHEIEGLTAASRQPAVEPGPWLQSIGSRLMPSHREGVATECTAD